jgi:hypothetical protein
VREELSEYHRPIPNEQEPGVTYEPRGIEKSQKGRVKSMKDALVFVVQKHQASRHWKTAWRSQIALFDGNPSDFSC